MMRDRETEREKWVKAFEFAMQQLGGIYGREFNNPTMRAYMDVCEGWSIDKMRETFRRAMEGERFCPTVAVLKAYGSGVREESGDPIVPEYKQPRYTPEQAEDIKRMRAELEEKIGKLPWSGARI